MVAQDPSNHVNQNRSESFDLQEEKEEVTFDSATVNSKQVLIKDEDLKNLQKEVVEYKDKYLRLLADAENARKRLQKERQDITRYAIENLVSDFLPPFDNLENALRFAQEMPDEVRNWAFGFQMILNQFKEIFAQHGIMPFESVGKPFNPHDHEAIEMVETAAYPAGIIIEESVRGYKMGDRTIRAARVKVAKSQESPISSQEENSK